MAKRTKRTAKKPTANKPKRPHSQRTPVVDAAVTACPKCGSTERTGYNNKTEVERAIAGTTRDGRPFTHVVWRRTKCKECNQHRVDRCHENRGVRTRRVA